MKFKTSFIKKLKLRPLILNVDQYCKMPELYDRTIFLSFFYYLCKITSKSFGINVGFFKILNRLRYQKYVLLFKYI